MLQVLKKRISGISSMEKIILLFCAVLILTIGIGSSFSYVTTGTPTLLNVFLNGMNPDGDLVIQKNIVHPYGDTYAVPEDIVFTFEVGLGDKYAGETLKTSQGEKTVDENGILVVTVIPGGRTTVYDIDDGTEVTVREINIGQGFAPNAESCEITVQKHQDNILNFLNTYTPEKADNTALTVSGVKKLVGREWIEGDSFTFDLSVYRDGAWSNLGTQTVTYELVEQPDPENPEQKLLVPKPDFDKFDFTELIRAFVFDQAGTYSFSVSEVAGSLGGVTYDKAESRFDILVGDADMDGYLEIQSITGISANTVVNKTADGTTINISFENHYAPVGSAEAVIEIQKVMEDTSGQNKSPAGYTFELYDNAGNLLITSDPTGTTGETSVRLVYEPTDARKTFEYVLKETGCGEIVGALTYDDASYPLKVTVVDNLDGTVSAYIYDSDVVWDVDLTADDAGNEGNATLADEGEGNVFSNLDEVSEGDLDHSNIITTESMADSDTAYVENIGKSANVPDNVSDRADEDAANDSESTSGDEVEDATDDVSDELDGEAENATLDSDNKSDEQSGSISSDADNIANEETVENQNDVETVPDDGDADREALDLTAAIASTVSDGDAESIIDEPGAVADEITGTLEKVTGSFWVSVPDGLTNKLQRTFTNHYDPVDASVGISGVKTLSGRGMNPEEFTFLMYQTDSLYELPEGAQPVRTVSNSTEGAFSFEALDFDQVGTYYYVVKEDATAALGGITYDTSSYLVKIVVTDSEGVLSGAVSVTDAYGREGDIVFQNTYKALPVYLPLSAKKILNGATLQDGAFRFRLFAADENFIPLGEAVQTVTNTQTGEISFETLTFREAGIYRYVMTELAGAIEGMTYDDSQYCLLIHVTDPGDGQLVIYEYAVTKDGQPVSEMCFENIYTEPEKPDEPTEPTEPDVPDEPDEPIVPDEPEKPEDTEQSDQPLSPQTGDDSKVPLYSILMIVSGCLLLVLLIIRRRNNKKK